MVVWFSRKKPELILLKVKLISIVGADKKFVWLQEKLQDETERLVVLIKDAPFEAIVPLPHEKTVCPPSKEVIFT